jgi:hypothetical protein
MAATLFVFIKPPFLVLDCGEPAHQHSGGAGQQERPGIDGGLP